MRVLPGSSDRLQHDERGQADTETSRSWPWCPCPCFGEALGDSLLAACFAPELFRHAYDDGEGGFIQRRPTAGPLRLLRSSQKGSFLEGKFSDAKWRREPEEGEVKGRYTQIWNSGATW